MKRLKFIPMAATLLALSCAGKADAQYYEMANQLTNLIRPALSGSSSYKGFVELTGVAGVSDPRANFVGISTSQGFQYASWFFMGAGLGVDLAMSHLSDTDGNFYYDDPHHDSRYVQNMAMIPVFSDFRFNIGSGGGVSFYIDAKIGACWFVGSKYLDLGNYYMGHGAQFFLQPSIGLRVPLSSSNPRQAVNFGVTYRLITSNNNYSWGYGGNWSASLNCVGGSISFEW